MDTSTTHVDTLVIGGGQAGLSVGHHLQQTGRSFLVVDAGERIGDVWRRRWDSLRLFTPARYDGLDGLPFPADPTYFPTKDEMGDYLEHYADHFDLPVRLQTRVERLSRATDGRFVAETSTGRIEATNAVVAMGSYQVPVVPDLADDLDADLVQLHSRDYRSPDQLRPGGVLLVGAGNSGAEIAMELAPRHDVWLAGRHPGQIPFRIERAFGRVAGVPFVVGFLFRRVLTRSTPPGRRMHDRGAGHAGPLVRTKARDLDSAGVRRVGRVVEVRDGRPVLDDGSIPEVANVVWCTGFRPGLEWIDLPVHGEHEPLHEAGVCTEEPGLYFVGLHFLRALSSGMVNGVGEDAAHVVDHLDRTRSRGAPAAASTPSGSEVGAWLPTGTFEPAD